MVYSPFPRGFWRPGPLSVLLVLGLAFLNGPLVAQEGFTLLETLVLPPQSYVGDPVEIRVQLSNPGDRHLAAPTNFPQQPFLEIRGVQVEERQDRLEVVIQAVSFAPGTKVLPPLDLGGLVLQDIRLYTSALVEDPLESPRSLRGQALPPRTMALTVLLFLLILVLPVILYFLVRGLSALFNNLLEGLRRSRPLKQFQRELKALRGRALSQETRDFYNDLSLAIRRYLGARGEYELLSSTTGEILSTFAGRLEAASLGTLGLFLHRLDSIRFGGEYSGDDDRFRDLDVAQGLMDILESPGGEA